MKEITPRIKHIWTGEDGYLDLSVPPDGTVTVRIEISDLEGGILSAQKIKYRSYAGHVRVFLCEILKSLVPGKAGEVHICKVFKGSNSSPYGPYYVISGSPCGLSREELFGTAFLTKRPQIVPVFQGTSERLSFLNVRRPVVHEGYGEPVHIVASKTLNYKVYFSGGGRIEVSRPVPAPEGVAPQVEAADVSLSAVENLPEVKKIGDKISAYDVFLSANILMTEINGDGETIQNHREVTGEPFRFVVSERRLAKTYRFINEFGVEEFIYATGALSVSLDYDKSVFRTRERKEEVAQDSRKIYEQNTGYLGTKEEIDFWLSFLSSGKREIILSSGDARAIILEDYDVKVALKSPGTIKFKWSYASKDSEFERLPEKLDDYLNVSI